MGAFNGYRLRQARELRRLTQSELADAIGVAQPTIARAEQGTLRPSDSLIETLALRMGFPVGWFSGTVTLQIPEGSLLLYRKKADLKSADRAYLLSLSQLALTMIEHLEVRFKRIASALPILDDVDYRQAASLTRSALGIDNFSPVPNLIRRLENAGVACVALPCSDIGSFEAFSVRIDRRPFMFVNPYRPPDRIRLTVAHELDHLTRRNPLYGELRDVEKESFRFGAEFLAPEESMRAEIGLPVTLSSLAELKPRWGIAISALVRRSKELGLIEEYQYKYLNIKINKLGIKTKEFGSDLIPPERPRALRKMFELTYGDDAKKFANDIDAPQALVESILNAHASRADLAISKAAPAAPKIETPPVEVGNLVMFRKRP